MAVSDYASILQSGRLVSEGPADESLLAEGQLREAYLGV